MEWKANKSLAKRSRMMKIAHDLKDKRNGLTYHYKMVSDYINPTVTSFFLDSDGNDNMFRPSGKILDSTATQASNILKAGMLANITPPSRSWFKLSHEDANIQDIPAVKLWLDQTSEIIRNIKLKSNFYEQIQLMYADLGDFGTACVYVEEDEENVVRYKTQPVGSYYVGTDEFGKVDKYFREYSMTVKQIVKKFAWDEVNQKFDWSNISKWLKDKYKDGNQEERVNVGHMIMKNEDFDPNNPLSSKKRYICYYAEMGVITSTSQGADSYAVGGSDILYEKGYDMFPILAPRWEVSGESAYGTNCPGFTSLGDVIQLQEGERKTLKAIDKMIDPPMVAPPSMRNQRSSLLPNDVTYLEETAMAQFRPAHNVSFNVSAMEQKQEQVRQRIQRNYYADLFLMLANMPESGRTATEINERKEEKMLALGPVLENLNNDFLDPDIDLVFMFAERQGKIPEPPRELLEHSQELKIQYISIMAQAQKAMGINALRTLKNEVLETAQIDPNAIKKVNFIEYIEEIADATGVPQKIIRSDDEVNEMIAAEQKALQQQQQAEQAQQMAATGKSLSETDMQGDNALARLIAGG